MKLEIQFVRNPDLISSGNVVQALRVGICDLKDAIKKARSALSDETFDPNVAGFQIVASGGRIVFIEPRKASVIGAPLPEAFRLSRWSLQSQN